MAEARQVKMHPGVHLHKTFMNPRGLSINGLARRINVPPNRISGIVNGERAITPDTALRLARYFDTSAMFWMNLQSRFELAAAEESVGDEINTTILPESEISPEPEVSSAAAE